MGRQVRVDPAVTLDQIPTPEVGDQHHQTADPGREQDEEDRETPVEDLHSPLRRQTLPMDVPEELVGFARADSGDAQADPETTEHENDIHQERHGFFLFE